MIRSISMTDEDYQWIKDNSINLSRYLRNKIKEDRYNDS